MQVAPEAVADLVAGGSRPEDIPASGRAVRVTVARHRAKRPLRFGIVLAAHPQPEGELH